MKNKFLLIVLIVLHPLFSQKLSHPIRAAANSSVSAHAPGSFPDTVKVLAILVQFQTDNDSRTSGNGRFDTTVSNELIIDAPPHDSAYVADHFLFAQNYFAKASNGKQHINATVLGKVITLKKQMKEYAPVSGNLPLAQMIEESWKAADSLYPAFPFQQYELFAVFHAGVGKDIDLRAALGYDPTPLDLPSLYFNLNSLKAVFGNTYQGVALNNSAFRITNTVVLPETEVRRIPSVGGDFVLKLGINGLLVASIGSHLGLPDLFDTKTGKSGIGRFGLMDGQSIFSFSGICPPEPNAWEKTYLGWITPIETYGNNKFSVPAAGLYSSGNDTVYKIPISAKEYYLVENRSRDAKENNHSITMKVKGQTYTKQFSRDENYFSNTNIDSAYGIIVDVDELDWSLPGLINANNNYKGGILVWHIDETVIEKNLASNSINADPAKRGVDLEEADGSQDIGQTYDFGNPASGSEDGSPIDYWFAGNIFPQYKNEFSENTNPNSLSNTLARSHIMLRNFSAQSPRMTFDANVGSTDLRLMNILRKSFPFGSNRYKPMIDDVDKNGKQEFVFFKNDSVFIFRDDFRSLYTDSSGFVSTSRYAPALIDNFFGNGEKILATAGDAGYELRGLNNPGTNKSVVVTDTAVTTPVHSYQNMIFIGTAGGIIEKYSATAVRTKYRPFYSSVNRIALLPNEQWVASNKDSLKSSFGGSISLNGKVVSELVNVRIEAAASISSVVTFADNTVTIYHSETLQPQRSFSIPNMGNSSMAFADVNMDGRIDIIVGTGSSLSAYSQSGTIIENFPYKLLDGGSVIGSPVVVGMKNSNSLAIIFGSTNGHIYAINEQGKLMTGFPLQTGGVVSSVALSNEYLSAASTDSSIYFWRAAGLFDTSRVYWNGYLSDKGNSNLVENKKSISQRSSELLPKKFAYNWPNPVYGGSTNIRYYLGKSATVRIKIVNLAGELVQELQGTNYVGLDNEVQWNTGDVQSGIYFAQITANGSGEEMSQIVKIAVVK